MDYSYTTYFSEIYDDVMKNVPYRYWFRYLKDILKYYRHKPKSILELASGTSNMTFQLMKFKSIRNITALDLSTAMLSKAAEKLETKFTVKNQKQLEKIAEKSYQIKKADNKFKINFRAQNMANFNFEHKFNLILSFFDSLNYLTEITDLKSCFESAANSLTDNGLFIFDMNSIGRIRTIEEKSFAINGENYQCFWEDIVKARENLWQVKLKICPNNDELPCFEEIHSERGYKIRTILSLLKKSGFKAVDVYNAFSFAKGKDYSDRLYFAAALDQNRLKNNRGKKFKILYGVKNRIDNFLVSFRYLF